MTMQIHYCVFCEDAKVRARNYAAQSVDQGKTVTYVWVCDDHAAGWNDGGDWEAPIMVRAAEVQEGDLLDLEGDAYADPKHNHPYFESEYGEVAGVDQETDECVAIGIEGVDLIGFPTEHMIRRAV